MKQTVSGNIKSFNISCNDEDIEKSMNKPIGIKCADIYLRFPEIMEDEANDLADFLEDEHIVYEGATDVFIEKDKEIERLKNELAKIPKAKMEYDLEIEQLNNIINELENYFEEKYDDGYEKLYVEDILYKLKELKESKK